MLGVQTTETKYSEERKWQSRNLGGDFFPSHMDQDSNDDQVLRTEKLIFIYNGSRLIGSLMFKPYITVYKSNKMQFGRFGYCYNLDDVISLTLYQCGFQATSTELKKNYFKHANVIQKINANKAHRGDVLKCHLFFKCTICSNSTVYF